MTSRASLFANTAGDFKSYRIYPIPKKEKARITIHLMKLDECACFLRQGQQAPSPLGNIL